MKNRKVILAICLACIVLMSCEDRVRVIELQSIEVDTTYNYRILRYDDGKYFYDEEKTSKKFKKGDVIKILR